MERKTALPELLAPAGSIHALTAALDGGADAVYFGAKDFNARAFADNFDDDVLERAVYTCHEHGAKAYITLNTLLRDREIKDFLSVAEKIYRAGADAVIVADAGGASLLHKYIPNLELHGSTQMSAHSSAGVDIIAATYGCTRVVLARETPKEDILSAVRCSQAEIEVFLHGALCVSHSGQCLMSSMIGGRSGNRGECAQPCRLPYGKSYPLSLSDLCLATHVPELIDSGVASLKIEGRMKSPSYVYGVTAIYRKLLDEYRGATPREMDELAAIFSRGGFTDGYFRRDMRNMGGVRSGDDKTATRKLPRYKSTVSLALSVPKTHGNRDFSLPDIKLSEPARTKRKLSRTALFMSAEQIDGVGSLIDKFDVAYLPLHEISKAKHVPGGVYIPSVIFDSERDKVKKLMLDARSRGVKYALVGNVGTISLAEEAGLIAMGDFRLNITNRESMHTLREAGAEDIIMSPELTLPQMRDIGGRAIVYGRIPLMLLERCVTKATTGCGGCGNYKLRDRTGTEFPVLREYGHRSIVLNSLPTYMGDKKKQLANAGIMSEHFIFTVESPAECRGVIEKYISGESLRYTVRRISAK